jgi:HPt (histidine-containing phosphotransfer) domain-containing protein
MCDDLMVRLKEAGIDTDGTLKRFAGNADLYEKFLVKFMDDDTFNGIKPAFDSDDKEAALNTSHTLKGVAGNLGMTRLYEACSNTVALIRADEFEKARDSYDELKNAYEEVCSLIR